MSYRSLTIFSAGLLLGIALLWIQSHAMPLYAAVPAPNGDTVSFESNRGFFYWYSNIGHIIRPSDSPQSLVQSLSDDPAEMVLATERQEWVPFRTFSNGYVELFVVSYWFIAAVCLGVAILWTIARRRARRGFPMVICAAE